MARKTALEVVYERQPETEETGSVPVQPQPRRTRAKEKPKERSAFRRRLRVVFLCISGAVAVGGIAFGYIKVDQFLASDPRFVLPGSVGGEHPTLVIEGAAYTSREQILQVFQRDFGRSVYLMPLDHHRSGLLAIDWVREASVTRQWPRRIVVRVKERTPVAFVLLNNSPALIDADGVIMSQPDKAQFRLPVLKGVSDRDPLQVRRERVGLMQQLMREVQSLEGQVSEIESSSPDNLVVTASVGGNRAIQLEMGNRNYLSRMKNFLNHYQEMAKRLPMATRFNLRQDDRIIALEGTRGAQ